MLVARSSQQPSPPALEEHQPSLPPPPSPPLELYPSFEQQQQHRRAIPSTRQPTLLWPDDDDASRHFFSRSHTFPELSRTSTTFLSSFGFLISSLLDSTKWTSSLAPPSPSLSLSLQPRSILAFFFVFFSLWTSLILQPSLTMKSRTSFHLYFLSKEVALPRKKWSSHLRPLVEEMTFALQGSSLLPFLRPSPQVTNSLSEYPPSPPSHQQPTLPYTTTLKTTSLRVSWAEGISSSKGWTRGGVPFALSSKSGILSEGDETGLGG